MDRELGAVMERCRRRIAQVLADPAVLGPPVNVDEAARRLGIVVRYERHLPVDGCSELLGGRWLVQVRWSLPRWRRRFTLAHEIAHVLIAQELAG